MQPTFWRLVSVLSFALLTALPGYAAAAGSAAPSAATPQAARGPRLITWDELTPSGWDPMSEFKDMNLNTLDDTDPRAMAMMDRMQEIFRTAPTNPALNGVEVKLPGYIVPLEENQGKISEFLLVPYYGACIHTPPPPANQIVHVKPKEPIAFESMDTVWISGRLETAKIDSKMAVSGYHMLATRVVKYVEEAK